MDCIGSIPQKKKQQLPAPWPRSSSCPSQALHRDIKATFTRAPAAADAYVSTEVRWKDLEKLFSNPADSWRALVQGMKGGRNTEHVELNDDDHV